MTHLQAVFSLTAEQQRQLEPLINVLRLFDMPGTEPTDYPALLGQVFVPNYTTPYVAVSVVLPDAAHAIALTGMRPYSFYHDHDRTFIDGIFNADEQAQARQILAAGGQPTLRDMLSVREVLIACSGPDAGGFA